MNCKQKTGVVWCVAIVAAVFAACDDPKPRPLPNAPKSPPASTTGTPTATSQKPLGGTSRTPAKHPPKRRGLSWTKPDAWKLIDHSSPMRKATYVLPKVGGDPVDGEMSVTQVGGGIEANIDRWKGQFDLEGEAEVSEREINGLNVTVVKMTGTFKGGMMGGSSEPQKDWMMLAAIVDTKPQPHFFKATGPKKTLEASREAFDGLVGSMKP